MEKTSPGSQDNWIGFWLLFMRQLSNESRKTKLDCKGSPISARNEMACETQASSEENRKLSCVLRSRAKCIFCPLCSFFIEIWDYLLSKTKQILILQGPVVRSLVSANRWLRGIKTYRFPWYLTLVSANHDLSNPGQINRITVGKEKNSQLALGLA